MKKAVWIALGLSVAVFILRLVFALSTPEFTVDESYFHLRQAEHIQQTGLPLLEDPLSFGKSVTLFPFFFDYLLAGLGFIFGIPLAAKILMNALAASLTLIVFAFAREATKDSRVAVTAALAAGFVPVLWEGVASVSPQLLGIVLGFAMLYCFLHIDDRKMRGWAIALLIIGTLVRPSFALFILGLAFYLVLASLADVKRPKGEHEVVFFASLFVLWSTFLFYKRLFIAHGLSVLWQNIPPVLLADYFSKITVLDAVAAVGVVPFVAGMYTMYRHLFVEQQRSVYLVMSLVLATGLLVWLRVIKPVLGLDVLGIALVLLFAFALRDALRAIERTKFLKWSPAILAVAVFLILTISLVPSLSEAKTRTLSPEERSALDWLRENTPENSIVLATLDEGHAIAAKAERGTIADTDFLLKSDAAIRVQDIHRAFTSPFDSDIVQVMRKYGARYVLWTQRTRELTGQETPLFARNTECFPQAFSSGDVSVYRLRCEVET